MLNRHRFVRKLLFVTHLVIAAIVPIAIIAYMLATSQDRLGILTVVGSAGTILTMLVLLRRVPDPDTVLYRMYDDKLRF